MHISAIVLAAGRGLRFKSRISKPLALIARKPIIYYSLRILQRHPLVQNITVVVNKENKLSVERLVNRSKFFKVTKVVYGGKMRQDSVLNGLKATAAQSDYVLIHDSARPFITREIVTRVIRQALKHKAALAAVPVKPTIKKASPAGQRGIRVEETLRRDELWEAQTPQVFKKDLLLKAYKNFSGIAATDDASLVEKLGVSPSLVMGSYFNIKITTPEDLVFAQAALKAFYPKK
jgi:2-C-methyl-D-erythritol 4-phosphate cytidylyltransferase